MMRTRLVFAPADPQAPFTYLLIGETGAVVGRGEQPLSAEPPLTPTRVVLVVPGTEAVAHWLHLPTRNDAQARAAAAMLLDDKLALADEPVHLALGPLEDDGHRLVVATARSRLRGWLQGARVHGLQPDAVVPDHLLLPEPAEGGSLAVRHGDVVVVRGPREAFTAEAELAPVLLEGRGLEVLDEPGAVERSLAAGAEAPGVNLLQGDFAPADGAGVQRRQLLRPALLAVALLLSPLVLMAADAVRLNWAAARLEAEQGALVAAVLPKGSAMNDPAAQAEARLARLELATGAGPAGLSAQLFRGLAGLEQAQIETLIASPDGAIRASISHANFSDMEVLGDELRRAGLAFREEGSRQDGGRVVSDVIIGARR